MPDPYINQQQWSVQNLEKQKQIKIKKQCYIKRPKVKIAKPYKVGFWNQFKSNEIFCLLIKGKTSLFVHELSKQEHVQVLEGERPCLQTRGQCYRCALRIGSVRCALGSALCIGRFEPVQNYIGAAHRSVHCALGWRTARWISATGKTCLCA